MRCERIAALSRYLITDSLNPALTAASQWFERTLDDSANKRIAVAEGFLCADAILNLMLNVTDGLVVYPNVIAKRLEAELPFMATENIMMSAVKRGGDRQQLHEKLREHSVLAAKRVKEIDGVNDLITRIAGDPAFGMSEADIRKELTPEAYVGRAPEQTERYLQTIIRPILAANGDLLGEKAELSV
jgi:adenylosuccinate lyase